MAIGQEIPERHSQVEGHCFLGYVIRERATSFVNKSNARDVHFRIIEYSRIIPNLFFFRDQNFEFLTES